MPITLGMTGKHHSEETRKKISEKLKGKPSYWSGKKFSEEHKRKLSEYRKSHPLPHAFKKGEKRTLGMRWKMSNTAKIRVSQALKKSYREGRIKTAFKKGHKPFKICGEKAWNWKGGVVKDKYKYPQDWNEILKESIRQRDGFVCQECGIHQDELAIENVKKLDIHHVDYNRFNLNPENLIALCRQCHIKTNFSREEWIYKFNNRWEQRNTGFLLQE